MTEIKVAVQAQANKCEKEATKQNEYEVRDYDEIEKIREQNIL
ncbi:hypothetical protein MNB_SM-4-754 [hydrothermal vent metagenome]|uniref:Uncharacterized protein n=1 Tax=hydrothermal vent metagenome TaxID=652676 RepID=A0A1W1C2Q0_9ZZZZ